MHRIAFFAAVLLAACVLFGGCGQPSADDGTIVHYGYTGSNPGKCTSSTCL